MIYTLEGLNSAKSYIRRELARRINLRNTPDITFVMDQSIAYGVKMSKLIVVIEHIPIFAYSSFKNSTVLFK